MSWDSKRPDQDLGGVDLARVERLMKRCQIGVGGRNALDDAHSIMAECYGTIGALMLAVETQREMLAARQPVCAARADGARSDGVMFADGLPGLAMFDASGDPRERYVRVTLDGSHCVMHRSEGDRYVQDARAAGDDSEYVVTDVYLSEREFYDLPERDVF